MIRTEAIEYLKQLTTPTPTGLVKYAPDGYYEGDPCVCDGTCAVDCQGECGCEACLKVGENR